MYYGTSLVSTEIRVRRSRRTLATHMRFIMRSSRLCYDVYALDYVYPSVRLSVDHARAISTRRQD